MPPRSPSEFAPFQGIAAHPFGHQPDHRMLARTEFGGAGAGEDRRDPAPPRSPPSACRSRCRNRVGAARGQTAPPRSCPRSRVRQSRPARECRARLRAGGAPADLGLEHLRIDPVELDPDIVGDAAMGHRLGEGFVAVRQMRVFADDGDRHPPLRLVDTSDDLRSSGRDRAPARRARNARRPRGRTLPRDKRQAPHRSCRHRAPG